MGSPVVYLGYETTSLIRPLTDDERLQSEADRRTADAFRVRRAQIVLASARRMLPKPIAQLVGCSVQTVRNVIHAFNEQGVEGLERQSNRPKTVTPVLDVGTCDASSTSCINRRASMASPRACGRWPWRLTCAMPRV